VTDDQWSEEQPAENALKREPSLRGNTDSRPTKKKGQTLGQGTEKEAPSGPERNSVLRKAFPREPPRQANIAEKKNLGGGIGTHAADEKPHVRGKGGRMGEGELSNGIEKKPLDS